MIIKIAQDPQELGMNAAHEAAALIRKAITENGIARVILATGTSQFETLNHLIVEKYIDWSKVVVFHLDEYIDLPVTSPASFRKYLKERFISKVTPLKAAYLINGETDPEMECEKIGNIIKEYPIDVALVGIGENGHLAFNDPPADFETEKPYIIVELDEPCRKQQLNEGWFESLASVPTHAISMSIKQIMRSKHIICSVPDSRKAAAVKNSLEQPVSNLFPASILQLHPACSFYLDKNSSALLTEQTIADKETSNIQK
jgi:glucosamine-6-phosphate deaminase